MSPRSALAIAAFGLVALLLAGPALAHPSFSPGFAPAGSPTAAELIIPHSCGLDGGMPETDDEQSPTRIIDVQVPDGATIIPYPKEGWTLVVRADGFAWTADDPTETTIRFDVDVQLDGQAGDTLHVSVYQECVNGESFSWIGTPDREAEYPAAVLTVGEEVGVHEHPTGHGTGHGDASEHMTDMGHATDDMSEHTTGHMTDMPTETAADTTDDTNSNLVEILAVLGAATLALGGGLLAVRGRRNVD